MAKRFEYPHIPPVLCEKCGFIVKDWPMPFLGPNIAVIDIMCHGNRQSLAMTASMFDGYSKIPDEYKKRVVRVIQDIYHALAQIEGPPRDWHLDNIFEDYHFERYGFESYDAPAKTGVL